MKKNISQNILQDRKHISKVCETLQMSMQNTGSNERGYRKETGSEKDRTVCNRKGVKRAQTTQY